MLYIDLETLDQFASVAHLPRPVQLAALRFGLATAYDAVHDRWTQYWADALPPWESCGVSPASLDLHRLIQDASALDLLWSDICAAGTIVGWNIADFDLAYLMLQRMRRHPGDEPWRHAVQVIDPFAVLRRVSRELTGHERWYRLDVIAAATLGRSKETDGAQASQWLASGIPALVRQAAAYCRTDVQLVIDLMHAATTTGLRCPPRPERGEQGTLRVRLDAHGNVVAATIEM